MRRPDLLNRALPTILAILATALVPALWWGLGMNQGLLLSNDIKSMCWPWAPFLPKPAIAVPALSDPLWQFVPWFELAHRELGAGRLPLWNPHQDGGVPLLGNAQSGLGSPLNLPMLLFGVARGWNIGLLLRVLLAFFGTFAFLRELGRSRPSAAMGAFGFALSGPFMAWLEHPHTATVAAFPLVLLFVSKLASRTTPAGVLGLAASTYLVLSGGHPETQLMVALFAAVWLAYSAKGIRTASTTLGAALLGACLSAPLLFTFAEYLSESEARQGVSRKGFSLPWLELRRFLSAAPTAYPDSHPIEGAASISLVLVAFVPMGVASARHSSRARFFAASAAALVLLAYQNPVSNWLASLSPAPIYWSRALLLLPLPLAALGSLGFDRCRELLSRGASRSLVMAASVSAVLASPVELLSGARGAHGRTPRQELFATTPLLSSLENPAQNEPFRALALHTFLPPNWATVYGLDDLRGYDALSPRGFRQARRALGRFEPTPTQVDTIAPWNLAKGGKALDDWNVQYLLLHPQFGLDADAFNRHLGLDVEEVYRGVDGLVLRNRRVRPRVRWRDERHDPNKAAVRLTSRSPTRWEIQTSAGSPRTLLVANPWFPGWKVRVDGSESPLAARPGDPIEVPLAAGSHRVELAYRPASFAAGCAVAALAGILLIVWSAWLSRRLRSSARSDLLKFDSVS